MTAPPPEVCNEPVRRFACPRSCRDRRWRCLPESWRGKTALQMPTYPDPVALDAALHELKRLPPLVTSGKSWR
jgi:hypothetical protein